MTNPEKQNENLEKQQKEINEVKNSLLNFWKDPEKDKKFIESPNSWNIAVSAIEDDVKEKSKSIKNSETKLAIEWKLKEIEKFKKVWKLAQEEAFMLSIIYKEISSLQWTEIKENNIQTEKAKEARDKAEKDYAKKLLSATEILAEVLKTNELKQQEKIKKQIEQSALARNKQKEPPLAYANLEIPTPQKENPKLEN